jgi:hypothetical protein
MLSEQHRASGIHQGLLEESQVSTIGKPCSPQLLNDLLPLTHSRQVRTVYGGVWATVGLAYHLRRLNRSMSTVAMLR